jgi:spore germination protein
MDLLGMPSSVRANMTQFFALLDGTVRKTAPLGLMAPPSTMSPSDTPGGDAFDLAQIGPHVDRVRMMTLDYSAGGSGPGPDIDPSWAASSAAFAASLVSVPVDLSFPLYGTDFSDLGTRFVSYDEARAIASEQGVHLGNDDRDSASGELSFSWVDGAGHAHQTWFEDGVSASWTLNAWSTQTVPAAVGVVLYGLGAEDPALWDTLARGLP